MAEDETLTGKKRPWEPGGPPEAPPPAEAAAAEAAAAEAPAAPTGSWLQPLGSFQKLQPLSYIFAAASRRPQAS